MSPLAALRLAALRLAMKRASARRTEVRVSGLRVLVGEGVCNPAPAPALGLSFASLFEAALSNLGAGARVLDVGTGSGVWALMAVRAGADVTATDLPHVSFEALEESARLNGLCAPRLAHGDLFAPVSGEQFDRVVFNPPFHLGEPADDAERAYLGGANGEVVRRFLAELPAHLAPEGLGFVILPATERRAYRRDLDALAPTARAHVFLPLLGRVELLELRSHR